MDDDEFNEAAFKAKKQAQAKAAALKAAAQDPEIAAIVAETKAAQLETAQSSRNAAKAIKETVIVAEKTTSTLKQQGEQLRGIDQVAEQADLHADDAYKSAKDLHKYKGLLPFSVKSLFTGGKKKEQDSELASINKKLEKQAAKYAGGGEEPPNQPQGRPQKDGGRRPSILNDDAVEREIDQNLDTISSGLDILKQQGMEMQREIAAQNVTISKIEARTEHTEYTLNSANRKIKEFL